MSTTTSTPKNGRGTLRAKADAHRARALAEQATAKARFMAGLPGAAPTRTEAASVPAVAPQQPAPVPSTTVASTTATPPAPPAASGADAADLEILTRYKAMVGAEAISFFLQHERQILRARSGQPSDTGRHKHLVGLDRVRAAVRLPSS